MATGRRRLRLVRVARRDRRRRTGEATRAVLFRAAGRRARLVGCRPRCGMSDVLVPTLFDRLGGTVAIDAAVDVFYGRVLADPELAPFFARVDLRHLRAHQRAFLAMALGGPERYRGRDLSDAHR